MLDSEAFVLRFFGEAGDDRLLLVNLGRDFHPDSAAEPLLAACEAGAWQVIWSSEDPNYGGLGTPAVEPAGQLRLPAHAAVVLSAIPAQSDNNSTD